MVDSTRGLAARLATAAALVVLAASTPLHATVGALLHADGAVCSLANAIRSANSNADTGGCVASGIYGNDTIDLEYDVQLAAAEATSTFDDGARAGLPNVSSAISIVGLTNHVIERSNAG